MIMGLFAWAVGFIKISVKIILLFIGLTFYSMMNVY